jgi:hypothetical protein
MGKRKSKKNVFRNGLVPVATLENLATTEPTPEFQAKHVLEKVKTDLGCAIRVRDKRPIDKYFRLYQIDCENGIGEHYRRGINDEQFRAADRLMCNYERTFHSLSHALNDVRVQSSVNVAMYPAESIMHAIHQHTRVMQRLSRGSQEIVEAICCAEKNLIDYEEGKGWRKGYGMIRLREALDELVAAFQSLGGRRNL